MPNIVTTHRIRYCGIVALHDTDRVVDFLQYSIRWGWGRVWVWGGVLLTVRRRASGWRRRRRGAGRRAGGGAAGARARRAARGAARLHATQGGGMRYLRRCAARGASTSGGAAAAAGAAPSHGHVTPDTRSPAHTARRYTTAPSRVRGEIELAAGSDVHTSTLRHRDGVVSIFPST